jgi:hypothetical protein
MPVVGYTSNTTIGGSPVMTITATAVAKQGTVPRNYYLLALSTT